MLPNFLALSPPADNWRRQPASPIVDLFLTRLQRHVAVLHGIAEIFWGRRTSLQERRATSGVTSSKFKQNFKHGQTSKSIKKKKMQPLCYRSMKNNWWSSGLALTMGKHIVSFWRMQVALNFGKNKQNVLYSNQEGKTRTKKGTTSPRCCSQIAHLFLAAVPPFCFWVTWNIRFGCVNIWLGDTIVI